MNGMNVSVLSAVVQVKKTDSIYYSQNVTKEDKRNEKDI